MENTHKTFKNSSSNGKLNTEKQFLVTKGKNSYTFLEQNEELFVSNWESLEFALESIDKQLLSSDKLGELVESLYILLYDEVEADKLINEDLETERQNRIFRLIEELKNRKEILLQCDDYISDYLKSRIYSLLF